jgi:hypothetical protein
MTWRWYTQSQSHLEVDAHMEALEQGPRRYYRSQFKKQPLYSKEQLPILFPGYAPGMLTPTVSAIRFVAQ